MKITPLSNLINLTTANTVNDATAVLLVNTGADAVVTLAGDRTGTFTLPADKEMIVHKKTTETLAQASGTVTATRIAKL